MIDTEMKGVLERIRELINELAAEYQRHLEEPEVTERAKNLFHDILAKMRSALDMAMNSIWLKYVSPSLSPVQKQKAERKVQFPFRADKLAFDKALQDMRLNLAQDNPALYRLLLQIQPFSTGRQEIEQLCKLANLGKHVRLAKQTKSSRPATRAVTPAGDIVMMAPPVELRATRLNGVEVDAATVEVVNFVDFSVEAIDFTNPSMFCLMLFCGLPKYISNLLDQV